MKKLMLIIVAATLCIGCASTRANKQIKEVHPLVGMWQYCQPAVMEDGSEVYTHRPIYKTIATDNSYFVSAGSMEPVSGTDKQEVRSILTQYGKYEIVNDSVYREYVGKHVNTKFNETTSIMRYKFIDEAKEYMKIDFVNTETGIAVSEIWRRVMFVEE